MHATGTPPRAGAGEDEGARGPSTYSLASCTRRTFSCSLTTSWPNASSVSCEATDVYIAYHCASWGSLCRRSSGSSEALNSPSPRRMCSHQCRTVLHTDSHARGLPESFVDALPVLTSWFKSGPPRSLPRASPAQNPTLLCISSVVCRLHDSQTHVAMPGKRQRGKRATRRGVRAPKELPRTRSI